MASVTAGASDGGGENARSGKNLPLLQPALKHFSTAKLVNNGFFDIGPRSISGFPFFHLYVYSSMSLRYKLLLIALSTLALPLAGWLFVRQMEELLRHGQEQALTASAQALARSLVASKIALPQGQGLYVHPLTTRITLDGYADDWKLLLPYAQNLGPMNDARKLRVVLAADRDWLYLLAEVHDTTRVRVDAHDVRAPISDHLDLVMTRGDNTRNYLLASAAPGAFDALVTDSADGAGLPNVLGGEWQEDSAGYRIEMRMPLTQAPDRIGLSVFDADGRRGVAIIASFDPQAAEQHPLLRYSRARADDLALYAPQDVRVRLLSNDGWVLAKSGELAAANTESSRRRWFESLIYRGLLAPGLTDAQDFAFGLPRLNATEIWQALSGVAATAWHPSEREGGVVLAAAVPLRVQGEIRGALLLEQSGDALPILTNRALLGLMGASLVALLVAGGVLFIFASVLSLRIRRLRDAAERAVRTSGRLDGRLPLSDARDELGDLSRSFGKLLDEMAAYTDYLRTLASKLSHELNTPLAIVKSSLDNLDHQSLAPAARTYIGRARDGAERLGAIVRAMSEASRLERAIAMSDGEDFDLAVVLDGCVEAYRPLAGSRRELICRLPEAPLNLHGAPEMIAQALDKLFDNALSFTPGNGWIRIELSARDDGALISMSNLGPLLPPAMQEHLFDSLVSVREQGNTRTRGDAPHLGLGLSVVRLVAELHRGTASASNLADGSGVEFRITLRSLARRRLSDAG
jgi:two-component system sensor histidine kinase ChvG